METTFPRRQVERSFRKFNDTIRDLFSSTHQAWGNTFTNLMTHCETDPVMKLVTEPLKANANVNADQWYESSMKTQGSFVGSGRYDLPYNDEDRTALLYQFFLLLEEEKVDFVSFCISMYGHSRYQEMTDTFNQELVLKFTREVSYRLDEILEDVAGKEQITASELTVFHYHDNTVRINGPVEGDITANMGQNVNITGDGNAVGNHNTTNVSKTTMSSGATLEDLTVLVAQLRDSLTQAGLDARTERMISSDLQVVEGEIEEEKPDVPTIASRLKNMAEAAKNAATIGTAASTLLPQIHHALETAQNLLPHIIK